MWIGIIGIGIIVGIIVGIIIGIIGIGIGGLVLLLLLVAFYCLTGR